MHAVTAGLQIYLGAAGTQVEKGVARQVVGEYGKDRFFEHGGSESGRTFLLGVEGDRTPFEVARYDTHGKLSRFPIVEVSGYISNGYIALKEVSSCNARGNYFRRRLVVG